MNSSFDFDIVAIGSSAGGIPVLQTILRTLTEDFPAPIMIVQHLPPGWLSKLDLVLGQGSRLEIHWAEDNLPLLHGRVYLAPAGRRLEITSDKCCRLTDWDPVHYRRPGADVLLTSAALRFRHRSLGIVLSGYLNDGAEGARVIRASGGVVIVQDPRTCSAPGMPESTIRGGTDFILEPGHIGRALMGLVSVPGVAAMFGVGKYRKAA